MRARRKVYLYGPDELTVSVMRFVLETRLLVKVTACCDRSQAIEALNWAQSDIAPSFDVVLVLPRLNAGAVLKAAKRIPTIHVVPPDSLFPARANQRVASGDMAALLSAVKVAVRRKRGPAKSMHRCTGKVAETRLAA